MVAQHPRTDKTYKYSVVVVDDEPHARADLKQCLSEHHDFEVVAEAESMRETWQILKHNPKINGIFLDIHIQNESERAGLDFAQKLRRLPHKPWTIFVSGKPEHALEAHRCNPVHFLTKPIADELFEEALDSVRELYPPKPPSIELKQRVLNRDGDYDFAHVWVKTDEVMSISLITDSPKSTCTVHLQNGSCLQNIYDFKIKDFVPFYRSMGFIQIHKSHVINLDYFHSIRVSGSSMDKHLVTLKDSAAQLPVGQKFYNPLKYALNKR